MQAPTIRTELRDDTLHIFATGDWRLAQLGTLRAWQHSPLPGRVELDGGAIASLDPSGALALLQNLNGQGVNIADIPLANFSTAHLDMLNLVREHFGASRAARPRRRKLLAKLGKSTELGICHLAHLINFVGKLTVEMAGLVIAPRRFRWKEFVNQIEAVFIYAIPLVFAMMFLLGLVFAYLLGRQAERYGANIFVVDGAALAICRELAPVIVAILVAGRSGAAITAQLGTMKVYEETDAISVLGLSPYVVLVIPRILALLIALPLLVFVGDIAGLLGSMVIADQQLAITPAAFIHRLQQELDLPTVLVGLLKAPIFALFIGVISCYMGLSVARDARSIGLHTTSTVVQSIVAVILLNAIIAITLVKLGI